MAKAILELEMPESCCKCPLQAISTEKKIRYCTVIRYTTDYYGTKRREDCPLKPVEEPTPKTNADRIRSMSDEELAKYIFDLGNGPEYCYGQCAYQDDCATKGLDYDTCIKGVTDWLRQPVKEG